MVKGAKHTILNRLPRHPCPLRGAVAMNRGQSQYALFVLDVSPIGTGVTQSKPTLRPVLRLEAGISLSFPLNKQARTVKACAEQKACCSLFERLTKSEFLVVFDVHWIWCGNRDLSDFLERYIFERVLHFFFFDFINKIISVFFLK